MKECTIMSHGTEADISIVENAQETPSHLLQVDTAEGIGEVAVSNHVPHNADQEQLHVEQESQNEGSAAVVQTNESADVQGDSNFRPDVEFHYPVPDPNTPSTGRAVTTASAQQLTSGVRPKIPPNGQPVSFLSTVIETLQPVPDHGQRRRGDRVVTSGAICTRDHPTNAHSLVSIGCVRYGGPDDINQFLRDWSQNIDQRANSSTERRVGGIILKEIQEQLYISRDVYYGPGFQWKLGVKLGSGASGCVYTCTDRSTGFLFCCKVMCVETSMATSSTIQSEVMALLDLRHLRGIVHIYGVLYYRRTIYILKQRIQGCTLKTFIREWPLLTYWLSVLLSQVRECISLMHQQGWTHGDIHPDNIMVSPVFVPGRAAGLAGDLRMELTFINHLNGVYMYAHQEDLRNQGQGRRRMKLSDIKRLLQENGRLILQATVIDLGRSRRYSDSAASQDWTDYGEMVSAYNVKILDEVRLIDIEQWDFVMISTDDTTAQSADNASTQAPCNHNDIVHGVESILDLPADPEGSVQTDHQSDSVVDADADDEAERES